MAPGRLTMLPWVTTYPRVDRPHKLDSMDHFFKKKTNLEEVDLGRVGERSWGEYGKDSYDIHKELIKNILKDKYMKIKPFHSWALLVRHLIRTMTKASNMESRIFEPKFPHGW